MKILVTGGLGYIGSHTVVELQNEGYDVIIIDNLSNSSIDILQGIGDISGVMPKFFELDLRDKSALKIFFQENQDIQGVIHFAASKAVAESVKKPLFYYENNVSTLINLLNEYEQLERQNFIFSSSCTVYGEAEDLPITENEPIKPAKSPYGNTKQIGEEILQDYTSISKNFKSISLRYFNPIGAHSSSYIGELPKGVPQNLVPYITQTAIGLRNQLSVYGDNYPTIDGTCIRDYIHVIDVAKAHVVSLKRLLDNNQISNYEVYNIGTGKGSSVLKVISSFENVTGIKLKYKIVDRRPGDVVSAFADINKAKEVLGWQSKLTLDDAIRDAWHWEQKIRNKQY